MLSFTTASKIKLSFREMFVHDGKKCYYNLLCSFRQLNLKKVLVNGGYLEYKVDTQNLKENGGQKICILALDEAGRVSYVSKIPIW